jgi:hypothetical protein
VGAPGLTDCLLVEVGPRGRPRLVVAGVGSGGPVGGRLLICYREVGRKMGAKGAVEGLETVAPEVAEGVKLYDGLGEGGNSTTGAA